MTRTPGEVSKIEAAAQQARAWFRDLAVMAHGLWNDRDLVTGRLHRLYNMARFYRLDRHRNYLERRPHEEAGHEVWHSVECITFAGCPKAHAEEESLNEHLRTLRLQVAQIVDLFEIPAFGDRLVFAEASVQSLGRMGSPLREEEFLLAFGARTPTVE